ncbi:MAG: aryl-sulfate sulfotransferase [Planctomycetota bacterium]
MDLRRPARIVPATAALLVSTVLASAQEPSPGFTLVASSASTNSLLLDENGQTIHTWPSTALPGLAVYLAANGNLLRSMHPIGFGGGAGAGGRIQEIAWDGSIAWTYDYHDPLKQQHHDIEPMPNGNVLMIAWDRHTGAEAIAEGRNPATVGSIFVPDHIVEVERTGPTTGDIVWEWYAWDHLIQDLDPTKNNFGVVADHPELIDINWGAAPGGDWMHSNSIAYNAELDQIVISSLYFDEIWVIDHSTTTAEAAGHTGGSSGKGGDLLYRWGNPQTYGGGTSADQRLEGQHDTTWVSPGYPGAGNIIIFNNNAGDAGPFGSNYSEILEITPPVDGSGNYTLAGSAYGPSAPTWEYTAANPTDFHTALAGGGAQRLSNGNTLIASPNQGWVFEVDPAGQTVWSKLGVGSTYISRRYERFLWTGATDSISLAAGGTVELELVAGVENAGRFYLMLGSAGGTTPGITIDGQTLPLNPLDPYFLISLNSPVVTPALGVIDGVGRASANFTLPSGTDPGLAGLELHHAYGVFDAGTGQVFLASNAEPLDLLP